MHQHAKNYFILSIYSWVPIFYNAHLKLFWPIFNICEFVSTCKKSGYFTDLFWRYGWLKKSCNQIGREQFGPYLRNQSFPKYGICAGTQEIIIFHYINNIHYISKYGAKKNFFPENLALSCTTSYRFLAPCQNLEKNTDFIADVVFTSEEVFKLNISIKKRQHEGQKY